MAGDKKMAKSIDVVALGELLIDFTPLKSDEGKACYERNPGGAPANVLVMLSRLGKRTAIISKVGDDGFGHFLKETVENAGVDVSGLIESPSFNTSLAFVTLDSSGDRSFDFVRRNGADVMLSQQELSLDLIDACRVFHFGSVSMTGEPVRSSTIAAAEYAKAHGKIISCDPNYRPLLWSSEAEAVEVMGNLLRLADVVKVSAEELALLTGEKNPEEGAATLLEAGARFAFVTLGEQGCCYAARSGAHGRVPGYRVQTVDTTGAGDTFCACVLSGLLDCAFSPKQGELERIVDFANAAAALSTTKRGAISAMPCVQEIHNLIRK